jgi:hypothetical protein
VPGSDNLYVRRLLEHVDLPQEMKRRKLPKGWDDIHFLNGMGFA